MQLEFIVNSQIITREDKERPVENSQGFLYAHFEFSEEWENLKKKAYFTRNDLEIYVVDIDENTGICQVPTLVIKSKGFNMTVKGEEEGKGIVITATAITIPVLETINGESKYPPITMVNSETILVSKNGEKVNLEIPNIYATELRYNTETGNLYFVGLNNETIYTLTSISFKDLFEGKVVVEKAKKDNLGNVINEYYLPINVAKETYLTIETATRDYLTKANAQSTYKTIESANNEYNNLQTQIDSINSKSDVVDIVANKEALNSYDTSTISERDVIKVLSDETQDNSQSYYRWENGTWNLIGSISESYSKSESERIFTTKTEANNIIKQINDVDTDLQSAKTNIETNKQNITSLNQKVDNHYNEMLDRTTTEIINLENSVQTHLLEDNKRYKIAGECLSFTPSFNNHSELSDDFLAIVEFYCGVTKTEIGTSSANDFFDGLDCVNGGFYTQPATYYKLYYTKGASGMNCIVCRG